jgi:hypothetical protein
MRKELSTPVFLLVLLLSFFCIYVSMDFYTMETLSKLDATLQQYFYLRRVHHRIPPLFELVLIVLSVLMVIHGRQKRQRLSPAATFFLGFAFVAFFFVTFNPNSPLNMVTLVSSAVTVFTFVALLWSFLLVDEEYFGATIRLMFYSMAVFAVVRGVWLVGKFAVGSGSRAFFNTNATLSEGDVLYYMALVQIVLLGLWLATKDVKYILGSLVLFAVVVFSFRRTWVAISFFGSLGVVFANSFLRAGFFKRVFVATGMAAIVYVLFFQTELLQSALGVYGERYSAIFHAFRANPNTGIGGDSGHRFEAIYSMEYALSHLHFFGVGLGGRFPTMIVLERWTSMGVHNVYADLLIRHGVVFFAFLVAIILYTCGSFARLASQVSVVPKQYFLLKLSVLTYLMVFYVVLFYNAMWFSFDWGKFNYIFAPLVAFVLRYSPENYRFFLGAKDEDPTGSDEEPVSSEAEQL